jgi:uncharacterized protein YeaO (DUF488 family)
MSIAAKRVYEPPSADDGERFLVERLWPRGVTREEAHLDAWLKDLAPSPELRRWFGHDPSRWDEFRRRYEAELESAEAQAPLDELTSKARSGRVTLVYAARDTEHNGALVLKDLIERRTRAGGAKR